MTFLSHGLLLLTLFLVFIPTEEGNTQAVLKNLMGEARSSVGGSFWSSFVQQSGNNIYPCQLGMKSAALTERALGGVVPLWRKHVSCTACPY